MTSQSLLKTCLHPLHLEAGAKMAPFAGFEMPLWYTTPTDEHLAVREKVGMFDVSHMGVFEVKGENITPLLEWLTPTLFSKRPFFSVTYTLLMAESGGILDDLLVYKWSEDRYWIVANASNREKVSSHLSHFTEVERLPLAILAIQGPWSKRVIPLFPQKMTFLTTEEGLVISGTGYTGEKGVEIFAPLEDAETLFEHFLEKNVQLCGLAARDTLRLEKGYALYGHELSETMAPEESVSKWILKKRESPYLGQGKLKAFRHPISFTLEEGIAREGAPLLSKGEEVGYVTSGSFSPSLKKGIGLGLATETPDEVLIRGTKRPINLKPLPFV